MSEPRTDRNSYEHHFSTAAQALAAAISTEVTDGAAVVSQLLATVAANLGGMHMITAMRPGSWEADYVDSFLASTVGADGEYLLAYRTEPIEVVECVPEMLVELGIDFYDDAYTIVDEAEAAAALRDGITRKSTDLVAEVIDEDAYDAVCERVDRAAELIEELRQSDVAAYQAAFEVQVQAAAQQLRDEEHLPAGVPVTVRFVEWADGDHATGATADWGTVQHSLWEAARANTPPPGFDQPLSQLRHDDLSVDAMRQAGRLALQRIPDLAHYQDS